ncbi:MAG: glycosyltransferase family 2 protein [Thermodesulfobacteriota bacterium]
MLAESTDNRGSLTPAPPPLVSIGMPVYNEARFLEESLAALLAQDYPHFEIILSDNGSTDGTRAIAEQAAARDPRVRVVGFPENRGVAANFIQVYSLATGQYYMWASGHDLWSKNLLGEMVALLESHPQAALAFATSAWIDAQGAPLAKEYGWTDTRGMDVVGRYLTVLFGNVHPVLGLMRMAYLQEVPGFARCPGADLILLSELVLKGDFLHATQAVCWRRAIRAAESHAERMDRYRSRQFDPAGADASRYFPLLALPRELLRVLWRARLPWMDKALIGLSLVTALPLRYLTGRRETASRLRAAAPQP